MIGFTDSLYTKLKTHEMNVLSRKVDSKLSALVSSSSSLDIDASSSKPSFLALFNATSNDQLEQIEEEDLALVANRVARAMNNVRFRKRSGPNHCFECGSIDHLRSHCPKLGRGKREDKDGEKTNDNKPKGTFKGRKIKENLKKAFDQVYATFEPLSDVDGDSGEEDKGKNISGVCFIAHGESETECEENEALVARKENVWIVDSGCSRHMTSDKNWFPSVKKASISQIVDEDFEVHFKKTGSDVFDSCGTLSQVQGEDGRIFEDESDDDNDEGVNQLQKSLLLCTLNDDIRRNKSLYMKDILRRFKMENCKPISTPIGSIAVLDPDEDGEAVDQKDFSSCFTSSSGQANNEVTRCLGRVFAVMDRESAWG
ncbi:Os07g0221900 [Oryza sativa Japonica Group]|uniref:Os07g0221900 protein n=1 Tax=Oryza sativa subsp. japonica TaxID=39947 RepID=C7J4M9_ORYSJ|nr:Os07g0221900 [Oryza sativa Japonica Group]|eukprot:NP_001175104.1 Os07g0221900 [Oryza sativa Japonica Group]